VASEFPKVGAVARLPASLVLATLLLGFLSATRSSAEPPKCTCTTARETDGWCEQHQVGYVGGIPVRSKLVFETMDAHGHVVDLSTFHCETCQKAILTDGYCERDFVGFVKKLAYFSRLTYELARGERTPRARITCRVCRKNSENQGWCERCKIGRIGPVAIRERDAYERAAHAADVLRAANEAAVRCEWCGISVLTDARCPVCRITYKDGKPVPPSPNPSAK
jgi:hypothetical protein